MFNQEILVKASKIKYIVTDVDGVLTDGFVTIDGLGNELYGKFHIHDGFAIKMGHDCGLHFIVISGRKSECTEFRCTKLGITQVYTGIDNKSHKLSALQKDLNISREELAYIGDDIIDIGAMKLCGLKVSPRNGVNEILRYVDYVTSRAGGEGCMRELVEMILFSQNKYQNYIDQFINQ